MMRSPAVSNSKTLKSSRNKLPAEPRLLLHSAMLITGTLFACSEGPPPTTHDALLVFESSEPWGSYLNQGLAEIKSFDTTRGKGTSVGRGKLYELSFAAELEYVKDIPLRAGCDERAESDCGGHKAGEIDTFKGLITFQKEGSSDWEPAGLVFE